MPLEDANGLRSIFRSKMLKVRSEYLDFFWNVVLVFLRPDDAFSFHILPQEVAEMFNTWAISRYDKPSLISIITLSLISEEWSVLRPI